MIDSVCKNLMQNLSNGFDECCYAINIPNVAYQD